MHPYQPPLEVQKARRKRDHEELSEYDIEIQSYSERYSTANSHIPIGRTLELLGNHKAKNKHKDRNDYA